MEQYNKLLDDFKKYIFLKDTELENLVADFFLGSESFLELSGFVKENPDYTVKVMDDITNLLEEADFYKACCCYLYLGMLYEKGAECAGIDKLISFFAKICDNCMTLLSNVNRRFSPEQNDLQPKFLYDEASSIFALDRENYKCFLGALELIPGMMPFIAKSRNVRDKLRVTNVPSQCACLEDFNFQFSVVKLLLNMCEEETIFVLSPKYETGFEVKVKEMDNNFMFFSLFQKRLSEEGFLKGLGVDDYNEKNDSENLCALFNYYTYKAVNKEGQYELFDTVDGESRIVSDKFCWGELSISETPKLNGKILVIIDDLTFNRSWEENFTKPIHDSIRPSLEIIRELNKREFSGMMEEIYEGLL